MPYTNPWDAAVPAGTVPASDIDKYIRDLTLGIQERLETGLIVDMEADPVVLQDVVKRTYEGLTLYIPFSDFVGATGDTHDYRNAWLYSRSDFNALVAPVRFPPGMGVITVTLIEMMLEKTAGIANITTHLRRRAFASGGDKDVYENLASVVHTASGVAVTASGALDIEIEDGYLHWLYMDPSGSNDDFFVMGARITYNTAGV